MKHHHLFVYGIGAAMMLASILLIRTTAHAFMFAPHTETRPVQDLYAHIPPRQLTPLRVVISALGIDAAVEDLGVAQGDRMAAPKNYTDVGWYGYGPAPGQVGTAVMYGHRNNGLGLSGVFIRLKNLKQGDRIEVTNQQGKLVQFTVDQLVSYSYHQVPLQAITSDPKEGAHLTLITCDGNWIYDAQEGMTYDKRLVVYAHLIGEPESTATTTTRFKPLPYSSGMGLTAVH